MSAVGHAEGLLSEKNIVQRPFSLSAKHVSTWKKNGIRVFVANKDVRVLQGTIQITSDTAVCWFHEDESAQLREASVEVYCEGDVTILQDENHEKFEQVYLKFETMTGIVVNPEIQPIETFEEAQATEIVLRGEDIRSMKKDEYFSTEIPPLVPGLGAHPKEEMVDIVADSIESWQEGDKRVVVALGNVKIKKLDTTIDADSVILWFDQSEEKSSKLSKFPLSDLYAEGNVTMRRKEDVQIADKIFEETKEEKGIFLNSQIKTAIQPHQQQTQKSDKGGATSRGTLSSQDRTQKHQVAVVEKFPVIVNGEEIRHVSKGQYEIKNGTMSTCGYGHPHYHFKSKKIRLVQSEGHNVVSSTGNSFYMGNYPVGYFPYLSFDIQKKERLLKDWEFGSSSRFGAFVRTDWDLYAATGGSQKDWSDLTLDLDYLQKRGVGTGIDFNYKGKDIHGYVNSYYINDQGTVDINNIPVEDSNRGTMLWRQQMLLPYDLRLDMEYSYLTDPRFLREYFEQRFKTDKDSESVIYLRRLHDNTAETFVVNEQFNGFDTSVDSLRERRYSERLPEVGYRIISEPIWDNRLIFTSESTATHFDGTFDQTGVNKLDPFFGTSTALLPQVNPQSVTRADTVNRISMPFKPWVFNINPFVEGRATGYSESVDTSGPVDVENGPATGRFIGSLGFDWSSTHWRSYSVYNDFFQINRLRHVFVPELRYIYTPVVTEDPNSLYQHDQIDALNSSQVVVLGVKNMLQTKRGDQGVERTVDFINFNIDYYMFPTNSGLYTDGLNGMIIRKDNFVNLDFRCKLTDIVTFTSERNEFNTETFQFDVLTSGVEVYNPPDWQYFIGQRYIRDISSALILGADYKISEKWSIMGYEIYDFRSSVPSSTATGMTGLEQKPRNLKTDLVLSRYFHDWVGSLTLELDPVRNNNNYRFDVTPKGLQRTQLRRFWF
jgi:lipopolysaccharide export system protein LptA